MNLLPGKATEDQAGNLLPQLDGAGPNLAGGMNPSAGVQRNKVPGQPLPRRRRRQGHSSRRFPEGGPLE